jgi:hypothetical protein
VEPEEKFPVRRKRSNLFQVAYDRFSNTPGEGVYGGTPNLFRSLDLKRGIDPIKIIKRQTRDF